jgi:hypothetical protein
MSEQPPRKDAKAVVVPCQMLDVSEFDVSTLVPPEKLVGVHVGGLSFCETILETSEFDCSQVVTSDAPATTDRTSRPTDGGAVQQSITETVEEIHDDPEEEEDEDVQESITDLVEEIHRALQALLVASTQSRAQALHPSVREREIAFLEAMRSKQLEFLRGALAAVRCASEMQSLPSLGNAGQDNAESET